MELEKKAENGERLSILQIFMLVLSIYALGAIFVQSAFKLPPQTDALLDRIDYFVCAAFFADFSIRFYRAPSKRKFLKWGWIDLISSIPKFEIFRAGRMLRIIRILRMLRAFRSAKLLVETLFVNRAKSALASVAAISLILAIFGSIAMLNFESEPESNIKTPADALWWAATTITTVGYGDKYPVTLEGRLIAIFLMIVGVGLFGTFTGYIASLFVDPGQKEEEDKISQLIREVQSLKQQVETLRSLAQNQNPAAARERAIQDPLQDKEEQEAKVQR